MHAEANDFSYDLALQRAEQLLEEWGDCQRREASVGPQGYARMSPEARMARDYGRLNKTDKRRRWAWQRERRVVDVVTDAQGRERGVRELSMAPERNDRQSRVRGAVKSEQWPEHIQKFDRLLTGLPSQLLRVVQSYYIARHSMRSGAETLRISKEEYGRRLERSRNFIAGAINLVDT